MSGPIFSDILKTLNPDLVIYDHNQPWAATIASSHNIPVVQFLIFGVVSSSFTLHMFKKPGKLFLFEEIFFRGFKPLMSRNMVESSVEEVRKDNSRQQNRLTEQQSKPLKAAADIEKKIVLVGSLVKDPINNYEHLKIIDWLNKKDVSSMYWGFVSHCGWSSLVESMNFGVPIIAIPMQLDQPLNVRLVEEVGVGLEVMRDENERFNEKEIAQVIRKFMVEENGEGIRNKARGFTEKIRRKWEEEIDGAVEELVKLCKERNVSYGNITGSNMGMTIE
ncbi:hypothetical protein ACSBR1_004476 [Camellia fascicularis]